jgi:hypothetical protein
MSGSHGHDNQWQEETMKVRIVRNSDGQIVATSSAEERSEVQVEPDLAEGMETEVVDVSIADLSDVQSFYETASREGR